NAWWDIIVIDECHNVAARASETGLSRRARLARLLATRSDTLMLLSATPHDGSARSFASLMSLLDPTAIPDPDNYTPDDFRSKGLVIRRFKKDVRHQVTEDFPERKTICHRTPASEAEEAAYRALVQIPFTQNGQHKGRHQQELQRVGLQKALFSSPTAAHGTNGRRLAIMAGRADITADEAAEVEHLRRFEEILWTLVEDPAATHFSRYQRLLKHLRSPEFGWDPGRADDRLVIFSERLETLDWLLKHLAADLK